MSKLKSQPKKTKQTKKQTNKPQETPPPPKLKPISIPIFLSGPPEISDLRQNFPAELHDLI